MYEAIPAGKHQQLQMAVGRYLRNNGKKTLSGLSTVIAKVFRFVYRTAICARNLKLMNSHTWSKCVGCSICTVSPANDG
jgi:hypothetical protein